MTVTLMFSPKFWLNAPGSKVPKPLVHIVYRYPSSTALHGTQIIAARKHWNGLWDRYDPGKGNEVPISKENILGWCRRSTAIDMGFMTWGMKRFHAEHGLTKAPKNMAADDGYWNGLMIYSFLELQWPVWRGMQFAPADLADKPTPTGALLWE